MRKKYSTQIHRIDGGGKFIEVLNSFFPKGRFQINFIEYDKLTNKQTALLPIYIDAGVMLTLIDDIKSGKLKASVDEAKSTGKYKGATVNDYTSYFIDMGGMSEEKVAKNFDQWKKQYPFLQPGMAISRQMKIQVAKSAGLDWVIRAEYGPGKSNDKGLIVPQGNGPMSINVGVTDKDLHAMMAMCDKHYSAYINQFYNKYNDKLFPEDPISIYTKGENT